MGARTARSAPEMCIRDRVETLQEVLEYNPEDFGEFAETLVTLQGQIEEYLAGDTSVLFDSVEWHMIQTYLGGKRTGLDGEVVEPKLELIRVFCEGAGATLRGSHSDILSAVQTYDPVFAEVLPLTLEEIFIRTGNSI